MVILNPKLTLVRFYMHRHNLIEELRYKIYKEINKYKNKY